MKIGVCFTQFIIMNTSCLYFKWLFKTAIEVFFFSLHFNHKQPSSIYITPKRQRVPLERA